MKGEVWRGPMIFVTGENSFKTNTFVVGSAQPRIREQVWRYLSQIPIRPFPSGIDRFRLLTWVPTEILSQTKNRK